MWTPCRVRDLYSRPEDGVKSTGPTCSLPFLEKTESVEPVICHGRRQRVPKLHVSKITAKDVERDTISASPWGNGKSGLWRIENRTGWGSEMHLPSTRTPCSLLMSFRQNELKRLMKVSDHDLERILSYFVPFSTDKEDHEFDCHRRKIETRTTWRMIQFKKSRHDWRS